MKLKAAVEQSEWGVIDPDDFWGSITNMGDERNWQFSLTTLQEQTGLTRESIVEAKDKLAKLKIIRWQSGDTINTPDILQPNESFQITITPATESRVFLDFRG